MGRSRLVRINQNAVPIFGAESIKCVGTTFEDYKKLVSTDPGNRLKGALSAKAAEKNPYMKKALNMMFACLSGEKEKGEIIGGKVFFHLFNFYEKYPLAGKQDLEEESRGQLLRLVPDYQERLPKKLECRSNIFESMKDHVEGKRVLVIGAGDGKVGELIETKLGKTVYLTDAIDHMDHQAVSLFHVSNDGVKLPFFDKSLDVSIPCMAYSYANEPLTLIKETIRVTKERIIALESVSLNPEHSQLNIVIDWYYNRILREGADRPFNFQSSMGWLDTFANFGLKVLKITNIGINDPTVPKYNMLFVLKPAEKST